MALTVKIQSAPTFSFQVAFPNISLELVLTDEAPNFNTQQLDAAIYPSRKLADSSLIARKLFDWDMKLVASPLCLARFGTPSSPEDLKNYSVVLGSGPSRVNPRSIRFTGKDSSSTLEILLPNATLTTNTLFARAAALAGNTIALVPDFLVGAEIKNGSLLELLRGYSLNPRPGGLFFLYPAAKFVPPKVQAIRDFLVATTGQTA